MLSFFWPVMTGEDLTNGPSDGSNRELLAGKYRLGRLIGEGGMGAVYEAEHIGLGAIVAVKLLSEGAVIDDTALARFRREARAMGAIRHDNVVAVMDAGTDEDGTPFLVMERLEGESLSSVLRRERVLAPVQAAGLVSQILAGLAAAHSRGIIHRDLKPGNVFVSRQSDGAKRIKILDFGVSKLGGAAQTLNVTADGILIGTPNFMAPEQVEGRHDIDARADLYAAGVILYRALTGKLPYAAASSDELYRRILSGDVVAPRELRPEIPELLEATVLTAMHPDREQRFGSATEFRNALVKALPHISTQGLFLRTGSDHDVGTVSTPPRPASTVRETGRREETPTRPANPRSLAFSRRRPITSAVRRHPLLTSALLGIAALAGALAVWFARGSNPPAPVVTRAPIRLGVIRYLPTDLVEDMYAPLRGYLEKKLGRGVALFVAQNHEELTTRLFEGEVELAAMSPYNYVRAKRDAGDLRLLATPVAPGGATSYEGLILSRAESGVDRLEDLKGKVFCYVDPGSSSGYLYPRALLLAAGIDPDRDLKKVRFGGNHLSTLRLLARGQCDAAAVYATILYEADEHGLPPQSFRVLASTSSIPLDAYCAPGSMSDGDVEELRRSLMALRPGSPLAHDVLEATGSPFIGFAPIEDSAYDAVRKMVDTLEAPLESVPSILNP